MSWKLAFVLFCYLATSTAEIHWQGKETKSVTVGDFYYFADYSMNRTWQEAFKYCKDEGAEIAKMTGIYLYTILLQMIPESKIGSYWIDGKTQLGLESNNFLSSKECTPHDLQLQDIPYLGYSSEVCLTLVKAAGARESGYEAVPCTNAVSGLICAFPIKTGCDF